MRYFLLLSICFLFITGCASVPQQQFVNLDFSTIPKEQKIGVYVSPIPKITTSFPGAGCLLCLGAASLANSSLTKQVETFQAEELKKVSEKIIQQLKGKGYEVVVIDSLIADKKLPKIKPAVGSTIKKNYNLYKTQYNIDQLLVVNFGFVGVSRMYSSYIPAGAPQASISAQYYMINVASNNYSFYSPLNVVKSADGEWDQSPGFPNITNAFYQAEEEAVDHINKPFN
jgi:hypothetical protein